jgi:hypothetical protein
LHSENSPIVPLRTCRRLSPVASGCGHQRARKGQRGSTRSRRHSEGAWGQSSMKQLAVRFAAILGLRRVLARYDNRRCDDIRRSSRAS